MNTESIYQKNPEQQIKYLVSEAEAARRLSMGKTKFRAEVDAGKIPYVLNGNRKLFRPEDLIAYAESRLVNRKASGGN